MITPINTMAFRTEDGARFFYMAEAENHEDKLREKASAQALAELESQVKALYSPTTAKMLLGYVQGWRATEKEQLRVALIRWLSVGLEPVSADVVALAERYDRAQKAKAESQKGGAS